MTSSKEAEKTYLGLTGSSAWEQAKPFSHPGADTLTESAQLLHDFAVAMSRCGPRRMIYPRPRRRRLLVLGSPGKLHRRAVALDISRRCFRPGAHVRRRDHPRGQGDMEALRFDRACSQGCGLSAGAPRANHPARSASRAGADEGGRRAVRTPAGGMPTHGLQVRDARLRRPGAGRPDFEFAAPAARPVRGRQDQTLSYVIRAFASRPSSFSGGLVASSKRPAWLPRGFARLGNSWGLENKGPFFEEAFGMALVRTLRHAMEDHPIILGRRRARRFAAARLTASPRSRWTWGTA